jgi:hypothetical protein
MQARVSLLFSAEKYQYIISDYQKAASVQLGAQGASVINRPRLHLCAAFVPAAPAKSSASDGLYYGWGRYVYAAHAHATLKLRGQPDNVSTASRQRHYPRLS